MAQLSIFIQGHINTFITGFLALVKANHAVFLSIKPGFWQPVRPGLDLPLQG